MIPKDFQEFIAKQCPGFEATEYKIDHDFITGEVVIRAKLKMQAVTKALAAAPAATFVKPSTLERRKDERRKQPAGEPSKRVQDVLALWNLGARRSP